VFSRVSLTVLVLVLVGTFASCSSSHQIAYVTTPFNAGVTAFRLNSHTGTLSQILGSPYQTGISPTSIVVHPSRRFAYVSNAGENTISLFKVSSDGALTEVLPRAITGMQPSSLIMDPAGAFLYAINSASNTVGVYSISGSSGALAEISTSPFPTAGFTPVRGAITPSGKFLYIANSNSASLTGYAIDSSGGLTAITNPPTLVGNGPNWIAIDPSGKFLYVANTQDGTFSGFTIDSGTGALTAMGGSPFAVSTNNSTIIPLSSLVVDGSGKYLYLVSLGSGSNLFGFTIDGTTGIPNAAISMPGVAAGNSAGFIVTDTTGKLIFVGNQTSNTLSGFTITPSSGVLTLVSTTTTGNAPTAMAVIK